MSTIESSCFLTANGIRVGSVDMLGGIGSEMFGHATQKGRVSNCLISLPQQS